MHVILKRERAREKHRERKSESEKERRWGKEGNILLNDALNTFYLRLYGMNHMHLARGNLLEPLSLNNSKGSFIQTIQQTG